MFKRSKYTAIDDGKGAAPASPQPRQPETGGSFVAKILSFFTDPKEEQPATSGTTPAPRNYGSFDH